MFYKKEKSENGDFENANGERFLISEATAVGTPSGMNVGYEFFETREEFLVKHGLVEIEKGESPQ